MSSAPAVVKLTFGRNASPVGIGQPRPTLSWRFAQDDSTRRDFLQEAYELRITRRNQTRTYSIKSDKSVEVPWPEEEPSLLSRERADVAVRALGRDGEWTAWFTSSVEAGLLVLSDWKAQMISCDLSPPTCETKRPFYVRTTFTLTAAQVSDLRDTPALVYSTAFGVYSLFLNGKRTSDHVLAPGWQSYHHRLHYQTSKVPRELFRVGENVLGAIVGEGWYAGRLTWQPNHRNIWGEHIGVRIQLEIGPETVVTDEKWEWSHGPLIKSELYDGETFDVNFVDQTWCQLRTEGRDESWRQCRVLPIPDSIDIVAPEAPPIRRIQEVDPIALITTPSGRQVLDFGQNLVGWVKIRAVPTKRPMVHYMRLRHAEVMENEELGVRPLRLAQATDTIYLGSEPYSDWEPEFTTHGFRYLEVTGGVDLSMDNFTAVVVHSDMEKLGDFTCSHELINKLHRNVVWGLRGNFVGLPTDCPQRDERMGWTGDLQVFASTASFLYDTSGLLGNWFQDLAVEQKKDNEGIPPLVVPNILPLLYGPKPDPQSVWCDVCALAPWDVYMQYGSRAALREMWESMTTWLDEGIPKRGDGLWNSPRGKSQLADCSSWHGSTNRLDPKAPADEPGAAMTDPFLVANLYLLKVTQTVARVAQALGDSDAHDRYTQDYLHRLEAFHNEYVTPSGRLSCDTQTAYSLALQLGIFASPSQVSVATDRLAHLIEKEKFRIATGFAGTPAILHALAKTDQVQLAYRMLQETKCPSWLYPVTMGATTIWERWNSLLPDGGVNPGKMTSFNHYALGAVANFLHSTVAGMSPLQPGWKRVRFHPRPGGTITSAEAYRVSPYGKVAIRWELRDGTIQLRCEVPPNSTAEVVLGERVESVGSGVYQWTVKWAEEGDWPPHVYSEQVRKVTADTFAP